MVTIFAPSNRRETMKTEFILDAVQLDEVREKLVGSAAFVFAYPATLYAVAKYSGLGSRQVKDIAIKMAKDMASAEL